MILGDCRSFINDVERGFLLSSSLFSPGSAVPRPSSQHGPNVTASSPHSKDAKTRSREDKGETLSGKLIRCMVHPLSWFHFTDNNGALPACLVTAATYHYNIRHPGRPLQEYHYHHPSLRPPDFRTRCAVSPLTSASTPPHSSTCRYITIAVATAPLRNHGATSPCLVHHHPQWPSGMPIMLLGNDTRHPDITR